MESLLTPDKGLMIWTLVTFGVLLLLLSKVAWKPLLKALDDAKPESAKPRKMPSARSNPPSS